MKMNAHEYLAFLQKCFAHGEETFANTHPDFGRFAELRSKQLDDPAVHAMYADLGSKAVGDSLTSYLREKLLPYLTPVLPKTLQEQIHAIPVGVVELRSVNACAAKSPDGEPLILFDSGLFTMVGFYMETKPTMVAINDTSGVDASREYLTKAYRFIIDYYESAGQLDFPFPPSGITITRGHLAMSLAQTTGIELFILAHELGHIYAGHLDKAETNVTRLTGDTAAAEADAEFYQMSWQQEYEADLLGWQWYQKACLNAKQPLIALLPAIIAKIVPLYFFEYAALVEANTERHSRHTTHPPATHRIVNILKHIVESEDEETIAEAAALAKIGLHMPKVT